MTIRRVQLAVLAVLAIPAGLFGAQGQTQPPKIGGIGGIGGAPMTGAPALTGASLLPTDPVAEFQMFAPQLNLRPDQQARIKAIADSRRSLLASIEKMLSDAATAFRQAAEGNNETGIRAGAARIGQCLGDLQVLRVRTALEMRSVLSPDQAARLQQLRAQAQQRQQEMAGSLQRFYEQMQQPTQRPASGSQPAPSKTTP